MNKWTDDQLSAITNRGGTLLVSAAAGSGKTAVLVERIIRRVIEEKVDINKFLVVTFTNAAAKEMKEKIIRAVASEIMNNHKDNAFLREQLSLVHKAQITTVHSFCFSLIRENFTQLKISPDFKVSSDLDTNIAKKECMSSVISKYFNQISDGFMTLVDIFGENNIEVDMLGIYDFIQSNANPSGFLENVCKEYEKVAKNGFNDTEWCNIICEKVRKMLQECMDLSQEALDFCDVDEVLSAKNFGILSYENNEILQLFNNINDGNWDNIYETSRNITFSKWGSCTKSETPEIAKKAKDNRDEYKAKIQEISELVYMPLEEIKEQSNKLHTAICVIKSIIFDFEIEYSEDKKRRNVLDFNDAEHKMVKLLLDEKTGQKSAIAHEISQRFIEVMVDEYQDTNEIQDTLFKLLSNDEKNIFMVGDIKQSIYKFRLADPMIFSQKSMSYKLADTAKDGEARKVSLSKNFRSRKEVLDATNFIFENIMSQNAGGVDYTDDQKLYLGANYPSSSTMKSEFCIIDYGKFDQENTKTQVEADIIANKINDIVENKMQVYDNDLGCERDVNYSDIVILLRATSVKAYVYKKALENAGINIDFKEGSQELFGTPEVSNLISLLRVLDNRLLEVELIAIMRSKIFDFSDEEIAKIRIESNSANFYDCVLENKSEKVIDFLEKLENIKEYSGNNSIFRTLWYVSHKFDLIAKYSLMTNGAIRRSNILRFLDFTNTLEEGFTVYDFVNFIDQIDSKKVTLPSGVKSGHSVKIVTMHKSKGLEYPVVFLADIAKEFNRMDLRKPIIMHNKLGIGLKYTDNDNIVSYPSLMQKAIRMQVQDENTSEEMRVLYVAMTRAKEKMYIMCTVDDAQKTFEKWLEERDPLSRSSYHYWFGENAVKLPSSKFLYEKFGLTDNVKINHDFCDYFECKYIEKLDDVKSNAQAKAKDDDFEIIDFVYPYSQSVNIPSKLTATAAYSKEVEKVHSNIKKPKFLSNTVLSATERGIAHHIVMQFIRFEKLTDIASVKAEIKRLFDDKFITKIQYECIDPQKIYAFINSKVGERVLASEQVTREFKFSVLAKASKFYDVETDDEVLLQGVIDCLFVEGDDIIIVDYKTDAVTEKNIDEISREHEKQLSIYATALEEIYGKKVREKYLYYFKTESFYQV